MLNGRLQHQEWHTGQVCSQLAALASSGALPKRCAAAVAGRVIEGRSNEILWILSSTTRSSAHCGTTTFTQPWMNAQMGLQLMMALRPQNNVRQHCNTGLHCAGKGTAPAEAQQARMWRAQKICYQASSISGGGSSCR